MAHFLCHLGCSHFGALLLDFYFTENTQYVYENYQTIDFSRFIPLLDVIDMIIAQAESHEK